MSLTVHRGGDTRARTMYEHRRIGVTRTDTVPRPATAARGVVYVWHDCGRRNDLPPASHPCAGKTSPFHDAACGFAEKIGNGTVSLRAKGARCVYPVFVAGERKGITIISVKYILLGHPNLAPTHSTKGYPLGYVTTWYTTNHAKSR